MRSIPKGVEGSRRNTPDGGVYAARRSDILAAVDEAKRRNSYVMAHCHTDEGSSRCVDLGVRSIEHGSLIKEKTAKKIKENNVYVVPTLSAGELIEERGKELGLI